MGFSLEKEESLGEGIDRILREKVESAFACLSHLNAHTRSLESPCHEARKDLKKVRSCLRMVRCTVGEKAFREQNQAYRDIAALLRDVRDAHVLPLTLKQLLTHFQPEIKPEPFRALTKGLKENISEKERELRQKAPALASNRRLLRQRGQEFHAFQLKKEGWKEFKPNLKRIYSSAQQSYLTAYQDCTDDAFHEWRKQTKYLRYTLETLENSWDEALGRYVEELHNLTDLLGDDHDILQLRLWLQENGDKYAEDARLATLFALIERRQEEFRAKARPIGNSLFSERPKAFVRRIRGYWKSWRMKDELADQQSRLSLLTG